jgi:beta-lactamase class A
MHQSMPIRICTAIILFLLCCPVSRAQTGIPAYYKSDPKLDRALSEIVRASGLDSAFNVGEDGTETISLAVIDLAGKTPLFGGVHHDNFIYSASVYKMYVAMEILKQASEGKFSLLGSYVVRSPNDVDRSKEISFDPRPLLRDGDTVSIHYLVDLMITRSDNSAANCLIDIAGRPNINRTIAQNNWSGSEVTRKFLRRSLEDPGYDTIRSTATCALHAADFMYKVYSRKLINAQVSLQMQSFLALQLDTTKLTPGLPDGALFFHKTGWWSYYTHDTGIVDDGNVKYIISLFTPVREEQVRPRMKQLSEMVYELMKSRSGQSRKN